MSESASVHLLHAPDDDELDVLRARLGEEVEVTTGPELPERPRFEVVVAGRPSPELLAASPRLRALVIPFAGIPATTRELLLEHPTLAVYNLHHNAAPTAELAIALLLAAAKRVVPLDRRLRAGDWRPRYERHDAVGLDGKAAAVLGYGAVGRRVGRALEALGMQVRPFSRGGDLAKALTGAAAAVVTLPLTPATEGLLGAAELDLLAPGAVVVNVGRAAIIDQEGLYRALAAGHLGAGLDVWYSYPSSVEARADTAPAQHPFGELDNVVLSPHRAGHVHETERLRTAHLADVLVPLLAGQEAPNRVDVEAGY